VVDDFEAFRRHTSSELQRRADVRLIAQAVDGMEAVRLAKGLRPHLILLDIGLPKLDGIKAARLIRELSPDSKILFLSQESSPEIVQEAIQLGARGYVLKSAVYTDLQPAINAVLRGEIFISSKLANPVSAGGEHTETTHRHRVGFYSDDRCLLEDLRRFVEAAIKAGNSAIVVATEPHRRDLLYGLRASLNIEEAIEEGRYVALDADETLSAVMVNGLPDPDRFSTALGDQIARAARVSRAGQGPVAIFGECVHLLWARGQTDAAVQFEKLGNTLVESCNVDILCGYSTGAVPGGMDNSTFQRICAEHSGIYTY
jgi:DNA-binding NarL/FixJ family response regulator